MRNDFIKIPGSKSYAQRAIICACFTEIDKDHPIVIKNVCHCADVLACITTMRQMHADIRHHGDIVEIHSGVKLYGGQLIVGESGTLCRILIPILASTGQKYVVQGTGSLSKRNMSGCESFMNDNNITFESNDNKLPIAVWGSLWQKEYDLDGSTTSQYISGIIMAHVINKWGCHIKVRNCSSFGYVNITIDVLKLFGVDIKVNNMDEKLIDIEIIDGCSLTNPSEPVYIEGDWSSFGAIYLAASSLLKEDEEIKILGMNVKSCQPDLSILYLGWNLFQNVIVNSDNTITIKHINEVKPFSIDISNSPDLFPYYAGFATLSQDYCDIKGIDKLVNKESNRGQVIYEEFSKIGYDCLITENTISIRHGNDQIKDVSYNSHNDHRIGQTLAIIKLVNDGHIKDNDYCIDKSYPDFIKDIETIYDKHIRKFI